MGAIIIRADQKSSKLLKELALQLGAVVTNVKDAHFEDFMLETMMDSEKTGEIVFKRRKIQETKGKCHLKIRESTNVLKWVITG